MKQQLLFLLLVLVAQHQQEAAADTQPRVSTKLIMNSFCVT
jgi:hypothetical protein